MKALFFDGKLELRDVTVPEWEDGGALVAVRLAGICNTDIEITKGYMGFRGVPGHEFVGTVEAGGGELNGKRVVGEINAVCGKCGMCARGLERHCPNRTVLGIQGRDGAFAEKLVLPLKNLHEIPDSLPDDKAVFVEPVAACFEILDQGGHG